jgi:nucleoside-diphosphate-sugar epimerase
VLRTKPLKRPRLLIVGCGDIGSRVLARLAGRYRVFALTTQPARLPELRAAGAVPILGNLDDAATLRRLAVLAPQVLVLAPPPGTGSIDPRSRGLAAQLARPRPRAHGLGIVAEGVPRKIVVYLSTTGVYGDCAGAWIDESRPPAPSTARAQRRVDAEAAWRSWGRAGMGSGARRASILRAPGIYGRERLPLERLQRGTPALAPDEDVYSNHIEADDLARSVIAALYRGRPQRVVNAVDDSALKMGDYFDAVADACGLPRPPRRTRQALAGLVSPAALSFMQESRRIANRRLKRELRLKLAWPDVASALAAWFGPRGG